MRKPLMFLAAVALASATFTSPVADGSSSQSRKLAKLTKRVDALAKLHVLEDVQTTIRTATASTDQYGHANTTAYCGAGGSEATGGGASFGDPRIGDTLITSRPVGGVGGATGWSASGRRPQGVSGTLTVYVICAHYGI